MSTFAVPLRQPSSLSHQGLSPQRKLLWAAVVFTLAILLVLWLPLHVSVRFVRTVSDSFTIGFNNKVADAFAVLLSIGVLLATLWQRRTASPMVPPNGKPLGRVFVAVTMAVSAAIIATEGFLITLSQTRYLGDGGYFIEQATVRRDTGRALYTQLEFAYGPLLLLPQVWVSRLLHCSMHLAYALTLIAESTLGLLLLAYLLNALPMRTRLRQAAFLLLAFGALTPHYGVNYTFFRFLTLFAVLWAATRSRTLPATVGWLCLGELLVLLISPELAMAMAAGAAAYALLRARQAGPAWLLAGVLPAAVVGASLLTLGHPYLHMASSFSRGTLNLPLGPYPHILVLLFAVVWLLPSGLGQILDLEQPSGARLLGLYIAGLGCLPAAFGRSDPLHVFFNGAGLLILSLVVMGVASRRMRVLWLGAVAVLVLWNQFVCQRFYQLRTTQVLAATALPHLPGPLHAAMVRVVSRRGPALAAMLTPQPETTYHLDMRAFAAVTGGACVSTPAFVSPIVERQLKATHQYHPGFYAFWDNMYSPEAEARSIRESKRCPWMLMPTELPNTQPSPVVDLATLQGYRLPFRQRHPDSFVLGAASRADAQKNWHLTRTFGPYLLYGQKAGS